MKRWICLFAVLVLALAGCSQPQPETTVTMQETIEPNLPQQEFDLKELSRLHTPLIHGVNPNCNWESPQEIDADRFPIYYQYLVSRCPEFKDESAIQKDLEHGVLIEQEAMEQVVLSHFDLTAEYLRSGEEWYRPQQQAYELCGIGGAWSSEITGASQEGDLLTMEYDTITAHGLPMGRGTIVAHLKKDGGWVYCSMTKEDYPSYRLEYPAMLESNQTEDGFSLLTGGVAGRVDTDGTVTEYDGTSLEEIMDFYRGRLEELGAKGEERLLEGENGWEFSGSYNHGKKVEIQVQPEGSGYRILYQIEQ